MARTQDGPLWTAAAAQAPRLALRALGSARLVLRSLHALLSTRRALHLLLLFLAAEYQRSLARSATKALEEGRFAFLVVDANNVRVDDFKELWATAQVRHTIVEGRCVAFLHCWQWTLTTCGWMTSWNFDEERVVGRSELVPRRCDA